MSVPSGCWEWTAARTSRGYGQFRPGGLAPMTPAHRLSYVDAFGPIPDGLWVLHRCDNRRCVNPAHLFLGTPRDNVLDMWSKGRQNPGRQTGEGVGTSKLSEAEVVAIRRRYIAGVPRAAIAAEFGISLLSLSDVTSGKTWRHLLGRDGAPSYADLRAAKRVKPNARITRGIADEIRRRLAAGETGRALAREFGLHPATVSEIKTGKLWR